MLRFGIFLAGTDLEHTKEAWDQWEIHCLILVSLSLQIFLFLMADMRRRSASRMLSTVLWLAYLSADTVAVFVLGHLAVHARGPSHELMLFWAPFVLVHLGGQETITAFSKQDNELWTRHLLGLITQSAVAGYVVSKSSWPDARLRAAMVIMFLSGFLKYAGRTFCLYSASPKSLRAQSMNSLSYVVRNLQDGRGEAYRRFHAGATMRKKPARERFEVMFIADKCLDFVKEIRLDVSVDDIMLVDAPVDDLKITIAANELPDMLNEFKNMPDRSIAYQYVAPSLVQSYRCLYTKAALLAILGDVMDHRDDRLFFCLKLVPLMLIYTLFQFISTLVALLLFASAQKKGHHSRADIMVSYILLVGAIVLDLLPALTSIVSYARKPFRPGTVAKCADLSVGSCIQPPGWHTMKQWSEELAQYSMIRRYITASVRGNHGCMPSMQKWILKCKPLGAWCVEFLDLKHTPVTDDLKLFVLDKLLFLQSRREEWNFAYFRGERALQKWMSSRPQVREVDWTGSALQKSLSSRVEFPVSVLIWHIATDICYYSEDNCRSNKPDEMTTKKKNMSRDLSHYIMYLVFKCDIMLTNNSRLVHEKAHERLVEIILAQSATVNLDEKETIIKLFESIDNEEQQQRFMHEKYVAPTPSAREADSFLQRTVEALYSPVLPLARSVAQVLIEVDDEADRYELISEVWLEMLFYMVPRCGAAFHYEHLSTGGEFITHVLHLMHLLGPFMPKTGA